MLKPADTISELDYYISGVDSSDVILFVHGLGADLRQFENQHTYFNNKYKVLSVSLRGHGKTKPGNTSSDYSLWAASNDIIRVLDKLGIERVHYVGNSMGGNVGYEILKNMPSRILTLTTFGTTAQLSKSKVEVTALKILYRYLSQKVIGRLSKSAGYNEYSKNMIRRMITESNKPSILHFMSHISNFDYTDILRKYDLPILIIKGDKDKEINRVIKNTINVCNEKMNFDIQEVENAGHFTNLDQPEIFNSILKNFLTKHGSNKAIDS